MAYKREGKPDYSLANRQGLDNMIRALEKGEVKHGRDNYLTNPEVTDKELVAAAIRHQLAAGEDGAGIDGETGLPHTALAMANNFMLEHRRATRAAKNVSKPDTSAAGRWRRLTPTDVVLPGAKLRCEDAGSSQPALERGQVYTAGPMQRFGPTLEGVDAPAGYLTVRFSLLETVP